MALDSGARSGSPAAEEHTEHSNARNAPKRLSKRLLIIGVAAGVAQVALDQAVGTLAHDQSQLADARVDLDRYNGLLAKDSIARQQVDSQLYRGTPEGIGVPTREKSTFALRRPRLTQPLTLSPNARARRSPPTRDCRG